jgi:hypothetical protein
VTTPGSRRPPGSRASCSPRTRGRRSGAGLRLRPHAVPAEGHRRVHAREILKQFGEIKQRRPLPPGHRPGRLSRGRHPRGALGVTAGRVGLPREVGRQHLRPATVDHQVGAGDVRRLVGGQEQRAARHLIRAVDAPSGICRAMARIGWSAARRPPPVAGASTMPGLRQFTRRPCGAPSAASCLVSATMPPLATVCAARWFVIDPDTHRRSILRARRQGSPTSAGAARRARRDVHASGHQGRVSTLAKVTRRCVRCGRPLRRINFLSGMIGPERPPLVRIECQHYACLDTMCWSTSDGRHLIATDCAQANDAQAALW